jgi:hypothetical protein
VGSGIDGQGDAPSFAREETAVTAHLEVRVRYVGGDNDGKATQLALEGPQVFIRERDTVVATVALG